MIFSSSLFLLYFLPIFLIIYHIAPLKQRNVVILLASLIFYAWGAPKFVFVVVGSVIVDFYIIKYMHRSQSRSRRVGLLTLSISINLGLLLYFKYANFFIANVNQLLNNLGVQSIAWTNVILPIGISFYTFQTLTYSIDIYRNTHKPLKNPFQYLVYILLFPQMIAGPIIRFNEIADQIENRQYLETIDNKILGIFRFAIGLAKKVLIANVLGAEADSIFKLSESELSTSIAWVGILSYTFQIYFDFSGYSDMAIGLGRIMGFKIPENFNNPYISQSISEFWRRWHITLGSFMRDYLYIPLGGSRVKSNRRLYFNLWFVFLMSGLWHGAGWNFILWGAFHGLFLVLERLFLLKLFAKMGKYLSIGITFLITVVGWVFFRTETLDQAKFFIGKMFEFNFSSYPFTREFVVVFVFAVLFSFLTLFKFGRKLEKKVFFADTASNLNYVLITFTVIILLGISIGSITASGFNPFIYFRF